MKIKNKQSTKLPIIYVNKSFEKSTLFDKSDIISKDLVLSLYPNNINNYFVNSGSFNNLSTMKSNGQIFSISNQELESDQYLKLSYAIQNKESIKVMITSAKSNGENYYNLLTSRPIVKINSIKNPTNSLENNSLNLFVYYNLNQSGASLKDIRNIDDFITLFSLIL